MKSSVPPPPPQVVMGASAAPPRPQLSSLYVGDLDPTVCDADLIQFFSAHAPVSARVCRDSRTGGSLCYAYVNFNSAFEAFNALISLNHTELRAKTVRIMWSHRNPDSRQMSKANLYVKNLDEAMDGKALEELFGRHGTIVSCKVAMENGRSKGFGFVQFSSEESAQAAIDALNGSMSPGGKILYVAHFVKKSERNAQPVERKCTNLYVSNLDGHITVDFLREAFSVHGEILSATIMKDELGKSKGFGFVSFKSMEDANKALKEMNGVKLGEKNVFVGEAKQKDEREKLLMSKNSNLYVKNLDGSIDDKALRDIFVTCGEVTSAKVMRDSSGSSRGFGFVNFSKHEEANKAIAIFHGATHQNKRLYVAIAQSKEERRNYLQKLLLDKQKAHEHSQPSTKNSLSSIWQSAFLHQQDTDLQVPPILVRKPQIQLPTPFYPKNHAAGPSQYWQQEEQDIGLSQNFGVPYLRDSMQPYAYFMQPCAQGQVGSHANCRSLFPTHQTGANELLKQHNNRHLTTSYSCTRKPAYRGLKAAVAGQRKWPATFTHAEVEELNDGEKKYLKKPVVLKIIRDEQKENAGIQKENAEPLKDANVKHNVPC